MQSSSRKLIVAAILGAGGVVLGATGAHALEARLAAADMTATWDTAVAYQMWHGLALLFLSALPCRRALCVAALCFTLGVLFFSGSLYLLALGGPRWLGPVTPIGGLFLLLGWAAVLVAGLQKPESYKAAAP